MKRREIEERIRYFKPTRPGDPNPHGVPCNDQYGFLTCTANERFATGGNRSGKTEIQVADAILFGTGKHPVRSIHQKPPVRIRFCAPSYEDGIKKVIVHKFQQLIKRSDLKDGTWESAWNEKAKTLSLANKTLYEFKSGEQRRNKYGGVDLDALYTDEHLRKELYRENRMRLADRNGFMVFAMTPEEGSITWEKKHIKKNRGHGVELYKFSIYGNPYLSVDGIKEIERSISDERMRRVKLYGDWVALAGMVYDMWDESIHVIPDKPIPDHWYRMVAIDPHIKKETAIVWAVVTPENDLIIYRCAKVFKTVPELKAFIRAKTSGEKIKLWIGDEAMGGDGLNIYGQESVLKQLAQGKDGIPVIPTNQSSNKAFEAGVMKIRDMLTPDTVSLLPRLQVFKSCMGVIDEFEDYQFIPDQKADEMSFRERVRTVDDDYMDDIRYLGQAMPMVKQGKIVSALDGAW